jgi:hypothetical protein
VAARVPPLTVIRWDDLGVRVFGRAVALAACEAGLGPGQRTPRVLSVARL